MFRSHERKDLTLISTAYQCYACIYLYTAVRKKVSDKSKKKKSWVPLVPWFGRLKIQRRTKAKTQKGKVKPNDALIGGRKCQSFAV